MDLRKAVFLKKTLQDSSFCSLNNSVYESAAEDSDSSLYYSFSNNSIIKSANSSCIDENINDHSLVSEADKENTVIMKEIEGDEHDKIEQPIMVDQDEKMEVNDDKNYVNEVIQKEESIKQQQTNEESHVAEKVSNEIQVPVVSDVVNEVVPDFSDIIQQSVKMVIPEEIVEDPNENLINPFTLSMIQAVPEDEKDENELEIIDNRESIEVDKVTKRKVQEMNKKSASKIPTRAPVHLYSPVQTKRKSLDKKSIVIAKPPVQQRRTVYETRSMTVKPKAPVVIPKSSSIPPVKTKIAAPKAIMLKCTFSGCTREFRTTKLLQDHLKTHNAGASSSSNFKCKFCDKVFELNTALNSHMLDRCSKIPYNEKRKLLAQKDKQATEVTNKRKSVFAAPPPVQRKRSPRRQTLNKSGVFVTPKKLRCGNQGCSEIFTDVLSYANHLISHKTES